MSLLYIYIHIFIARRRFSFRYSRKHGKVRAFCVQGGETWCTVRDSCVLFESYKLGRMKMRMLKRRLKREQVSERMSEQTRMKALLSRERESAVFSQVRSFARSLTDGNLHCVSVLVVAPNVANVKRCNDSHSKLTLFALPRRALSHTKSQCSCLENAASIAFPQTRRI